MTTYLEKYTCEKSWYKRARIINLYKCILAVRKKPCSTRVLAKYFGVSNGMISESIKIAENYKLVNRCRTRKDALELIKGK